MAAGTITESVAVKGRVQVVTLTWTSDASGNVNGTTFGYNGLLMRFCTNPGSTAPSDNWDFVLNDADAADVLEGAGADRDTTNSESKALAAPVLLAGTLEPQISNAGNAKNGTIVLYIAQLR